MSVDARPLSLGQQSLWLLYKLAPDSAAYNDAGAVSFRPGPDVAALRRAVAAVVERHGLLRSRFVEEGGRPVRVVCPPELVSLQVRDVPEGRLRELAREVATTPLRLEEDGPLRVVLLRGRDEGVIVVCTHHIASDAISTRILWRDLGEAYRAAVTYDTPQWPALTATYDDFVADERELLDSPRRAEMESYWHDVCAGAVPAELPTDRPRPERSALSGAACARFLPPDLVERVRATAAAASVTPFAVLLGAFQSLLYRYTGQSDLTIGCPTTLRRRKALRDMVGLLVNTMVLRARFTPTTTLAEAVESAARQVGDGARHARYPYALATARSSSRAPLFRIMLTMVTPQAGDRLPIAGAGSASLAGHRVEMLDVPYLEGQADLTVGIVSSPAATEVSFRYDTELFDAATIERMLDRYLVLIAATCDQPQTRVSRVRMTDEAERRRLLALGAAPA